MSMTLAARAPGTLPKMRGIRRPVFVTTLLCILGGPLWSTAVAQDSSPALEAAIAYSTNVFKLVRCPDDCETGRVEELHQSYRYSIHDQTRSGASGWAAYVGSVIDTFVRVELGNTIDVTQTTDGAADIDVVLIDASEAGQDDNRLATCASGVTILDGEIAGGSLRLDVARSEGDGSGSLSIADKACLDAFLAALFDYREQELAAFPTAAAGGPVSLMYWRALMDMRSRHTGSVTAFAEALREEITANKTY